jgi:RNA polymerase sigma factor (TIGR02999 family)
MKGTSAGQISTLLRAWNEGDDQALAKITPLVYKELYRAAQRCMAQQNPGHILQSTALVNEVYLRLAELGQVDWRDRAHFFAACAQSMRHILTDYARSRLSLKRGGQAEHVPFDEALATFQVRGVDFVALNDALNILSKIDDRKSRVVDLRFFGGLSVKETSEVLKISEDTVRRDWNFAKHWLLSELRNGRSNGK